MEIFITIIHYLVCLFLILTVLLQAGKGADIGAAFGAGSSQTLFGPRGAATFLNKMTAVVAIVFLTTSLSLVTISRNKSQKSVLTGVPEKTSTETAPAEEAPAEQKSEPAAEPETEKNP